MKLKRTSLVSYLTTLIGLIMTLAVVALLLVTALHLQRATSEVQVAMAQRSTYQHLLTAFIREEGIQNAYTLSPGPVVRRDQSVIATSISQGVHSLQQDADPTDDVLSEHISAGQTRYLLYSGQFFTAIDGKAFTQADTLRSQDIDPLLHQMEQELSQRFPLVMSRAVQALAQLTLIQRAFLVLGPSVLLISVLLIVVTMLMLRTYRRKLEEAARSEVIRLQHLAFTDPLTGLGNHFAYQERLALLLRETPREEAALVLALLDLDEFQHVNDDQGYGRGDDLLKSFATLLREARLSEALFRLNGDDFALILPHSSLPEATVALERLREDVQHRVPAMSVSIGIAHTSSEESTQELLQAQATAALEEAKRRGRNRVVAFAGMAGEVSIVSFAKTRMARQVLSERKIRVVFQPIWDLRTQRVLAYEALSRPDPSYGLSGPQELFDVIERIGRAHELDAICVEAILARADELPPDALLFLNLSPQSLVHDLLTETTLVEAVVSAGLQPSQVVLEVTERAIVRLDELIEKVKRLQRFGFRIALDDAGAGNAGLEMLSRLPVDFVKIDRMVVSNARTDQAARSVFLGLTTIACEARIDVVAEGIETPELLAYVQQAGVRCAQGYLLGRPGSTIAADSPWLDPSPSFPALAEVGPG